MNLKDTNTNIDLADNIMLENIFLMTELLNIQKPDVFDKKSFVKVDKSVFKALTRPYFVGGKPYTLFELILNLAKLAETIEGKIDTKALKKAIYHDETTALSTQERNKYDSNLKLAHDLFFCFAI